MINVTLGEAKTQNSKPFPKISKYTYTSGNTCILLMYSNKKATVLQVSKSSKTATAGDKIGDVWDIQDYPNGFTDYNEPITIQNA